MTLYRLRENEHGVFGVLCTEKVCICATLERPWLNNAPNVSCIAPGTYKAKRVQSPHFGETFEVVVDGRSHILFHTGNWMTDSKGCIIIGYAYCVKNNQQALDMSGVAFDRFMGMLKGVNEFTLKVSPTLA